MLHIAICDDQPKELEIIKEFITEYLRDHLLEAELIEFTHPDELLTTIQNRSFHLYILDIIMPMINGIKLGKDIRCFDRGAQIIYATTEPGFALQAYVASPINYLIKPIDKQQLFDTLTFALTKIDLSEEQIFAVKTTQSLRVLNLSEILCCEYRSHAVIFTLTNGEEVISRTFRESFTEYCVPLRRDALFVQCHTSYFINMRRVERFAKNSFTLRGGKIVPIAAKQYSVVRDKYMDYLMAREVRR